MPGCIFEYYGRIPASVYAPPETFESPLEEAVFNNDLQRFLKLVQVRQKPARLGYASQLVQIRSFSGATSEYRFKIGHFVPTGAG